MQLPTPTSNPNGASAGESSRTANAEENTAGSAIFDPVRNVWKDIVKDYIIRPLH